MKARDHLYVTPNTKEDWIENHWKNRSLDFLQFIFSVSRDCQQKTWIGEYIESRLQSEGYENHLTWKDIAI